NAGVQHVAPIEEFPPDTFSAMLRLMVEVPFRLVRQVLPGMYARGFGRIVNISSVHGVRASEFKSAYVAAKHGLEGLSKVVALEGAPHGVTSNCVNPAYVRTPLVTAQLADQAATHGLTEAEVMDRVLLEPVAVKRLIEPAGAAELAARLFVPQGEPLSGTLLRFATCAVGFFARPSGGVVFGHFGDRLGRKNLLVLSLLMMGLATFGIGLLPTYAQVGALAPILLTVLRLI